jgi:hypothetical protein
VSLTWKFRGVIIQESIIEGKQRTLDAWATKATTTKGKEKEV